MELRKQWTIAMKQNIGGGGIMPPVLDPFDPSVFYVSDGWGSYYSSMRLRKLSVETGEELDSVLTRDGVRCLHIEEDRLFAVLNKRILEVDRVSLQVIRTYKKGVPLSMDCVASDGKNQLLMMNRNGCFLNLLDLTTGSVRKKKVETCCGILREGADSFLICTRDGLLRYTTGQNRLIRLAELEGCVDCAWGGRLYLLCHGPAGADSARLLEYDPRSGGEPRELLSGVRARQLALCRDGEHIALLWNNCLTLYPAAGSTVIFQHSFEKEFVFEDGFRMFDETAILTYRWSNQLLTRWTLEGGTLTRKID